jgi:hypothetical protein
MRHDGVADGIGGASGGVDDWAALWRADAGGSGDEVTVCAS